MMLNNNETYRIIVTLVNQEEIIILQSDDIDEIDSTYRLIREKMNEDTNSIDFGTYIIPSKHIFYVRSELLYTTLS